MSCYCAGLGLDRREWRFPKRAKSISVQTMRIRGALITQQSLLLFGHNRSKGRRRRASAGVESSSAACFLG